MKRKANSNVGQTMHLPDPAELANLSDDQITVVLNNLFEPCDTLNAYLLPFVRANNFNTYTDLIEACRSKLVRLLEEYKTDSENQAQRTKICKIVSAHPRLGVPKKLASSLSEHSKNEQKSLSSDGVDGARLAQQLQELNEKYEQTFPGLIFVVFVNGRSREEIMKIMRYRIANSNWNNEVYTAFNAMSDIALDRARKLNAKL